MSSTEDIRNGFALDEFGQINDRWLEEFDQWLAAHDAEVRAAALASTPSPAQPTEANELVKLIRATDRATEHANNLRVMNCTPHRAGWSRTRWEVENPHVDADEALRKALTATLAPSPVQGALSAEERGIIIDALIEHERTSTARKAANSASNSDERAEMCKALIVRLGSPVQGADDRLAQAEVIPLTPDEAREILGMSRDEPNDATGYNTRKAYEALTATYQQSPQAALNEVRAEVWEQAAELADSRMHPDDLHCEVCRIVAPLRARAAELRAGSQTK